MYRNNYNTLIIIPPPFRYDTKLSVEVEFDFHLFIPFSCTKRRGALHHICRMSYLSLLCLQLYATVSCM